MGDGQAGSVNVCFAKMFHCGTDHGENLKDCLVSLSQPFS